MTLYLWRPKMLIARKTSCFYDCELWWIHIPQRSTMKDGQGVSIWVGGWFEVGVGVGVPRNMNVGLSGTHRRYVLYIWNDVKSGALIDRFWSVESLVQAMSADRVAMFGPAPMSLVKELDYRVLATRPSVHSSICPPVQNEQTSRLLPIGLPIIIRCLSGSNFWFSTPSCAPHFPHSLKIY